MQYQPSKVRQHHLTSCTISVFIAFCWIFLSIPLSAAQSKPTAQKIEETARSLVGKEMWKSGYGLKNGGLGCAASVSNVLNEAGIKYVRSAATKFMRLQILKGKLKVKEYVVKEGGNGPIDDKKLLSVARPGDVLVAFMNPLPQGNIGPKAHCGIIGRNGRVYTNDWNDGIWKNGNIYPAN